MTTKSTALSKAPPNSRDCPRARAIRPPTRSVPTITAPGENPPAADRDAPAPAAKHTLPRTGRRARSVADLQRYILEEWAEEYSQGKVGRREFLRRVALMSGGAALALPVLQTLGVAASAEEIAQAAGGPVAPTAQAPGGPGPPERPRPPAPPRTPPP